MQSPESDPDVDADTDVNDGLKPNGTTECLSKLDLRKIEGLTHVGKAAQCTIAVSSLENLGRGVGTLLRYVLSIRFDSDVVFR